MTTPNKPDQAICPACGEAMRREMDGMRVPPMPQVFWFCINSNCKDGENNKLFRGG